jgi:basic amino acid/polyamine antiporter, APA family
VPFINGKYIIPVLLIGSMIYIQLNVPGYFAGLFKLETLPMIIFFIVAIYVAILTFLRSFSLIPVLGLLSCFYLMAQESHTNWFRFLIWLVIGLAIYFMYGRHNSKLAKK